MRLFASCRLLYELSNEYLTAITGFVTWEKFGFEAARVMTRLSHDVIKVFAKSIRML